MLTKFLTLIKNFLKEEPKPTSSTKPKSNIVVECPVYYEVKLGKLIILIRAEDFTRKTFNG